MCEFSSHTHAHTHAHVRTHTHTITNQGSSGDQQALSGQQHEEPGSTDSHPLLPEHRHKHRLHQVHTYICVYTTYAYSILAIKDFILYMAGSFAREKFGEFRGVATIRKRCFIRASSRYETLDTCTLGSFLVVYCKNCLCLEVCIRSDFYLICSPSHCKACGG